jgi:hypothetical protein
MEVKLLHLRSVLISSAIFFTLTVGEAVCCENPLGCDPPGHSNNSDSNHDSDDPESPCLTASDECHTRSDASEEACHNHCEGRLNHVDCLIRCDDMAQSQVKLCDAVFQACIERVRKEEED